MQTGRRIGHRKGAIARAFRAEHIAEWRAAARAGMHRIDRRYASHTRAPGRSHPAQRVGEMASRAASRMRCRHVGTATSRCASSMGSTPSPQTLYEEAEPEPLN